MNRHGQIDAMPGRDLADWLNVINPSRLDYLVNENAELDGIGQSESASITSPITPKRGTSYET